MGMDDILYKVHIYSWPAAIVDFNWFLVCMSTQISTKIIAKGIKFVMEVLLYYT